MAGLAWAGGVNAEGLYADFSTSMGDFTVRLDFERAPTAVAGFAGLATGERLWLDAQTNLNHRPYYHDSIFHRVVKDGPTGNGIAIQGGGQPSVNISTGVTNFIGPGYTMLENVTNGLTHSNGVISMANSGPNTDGSQFFITTTNVPFWDGGYTVFGHVVSGMPVVEAIAAVPVQGGGSRPVEDVHLHAVAIRRVGAAAEAFDIHAQGVPEPESTPLGMSSDGTHLWLYTELATQTRPLLFSQSSNMFHWDRERMFPHFIFYTNATLILTNQLTLTGLPQRYFFHTARVRHPVPVTTPVNNRGRTFTFYWDRDPPLVYQATFNSHHAFPGTGWVQEGTNTPFPRTIFIGDGWQQSAYSARLYFMDDLSREYQYSLAYHPGQITNRFTGSWRPWEGVWQPISGVFTME